MVNLRTRRSEVRRSTWQHHTFDGMHANHVTIFQTELVLDHPIRDWRKIYSRTGSTDVPSTWPLRARAIYSIRHQTCNSLLPLLDPNSPLIFPFTKSKVTRTRDRKGSLNCILCPQSNHESTKQNAVQCNAWSTTVYVDVEGRNTPTPNNEFSSRHWKRADLSKQWNPKHQYTSTQQVWLSITLKTMHHCVLWLVVWTEQYHVIPPLLQKGFHRHCF